LAVAGPVSPGEVLELAGRHLGEIPRGGVTAVGPPPSWPDGPVVEAVEHDDAQVEFALAFPCVPERHRDYPAHLCLRRLLDDGLSSRLPYRIVERLGLAYSIHAALETFADSALFTFEGACSPAKLGRVVAAVLGVLSETVGTPVGDDELRRVQERHRMSLTFALDSPPDLVGWLGTGEVLDAAEDFEHRCRRVEQVTPTDVLRVARQTFTRKNLLAVAVGPRAEAARRAIRRATSSSALG
jgi:predicted Zn-dependent peptidase